MDRRVLQYVFGSIRKVLRFRCQRWFSFYLAINRVLRLDFVHYQGCGGEVELLLQFRPIIRVYFYRRFFDQFADRACEEEHLLFIVGRHGFVIAYQGGRAN